MARLVTRYGDIRVSFARSPAYRLRLRFSSYGTSRVQATFFYWLSSHWL
jgi:hypothetical protein